MVIYFIRVKEIVGTMKKEYLAPTSDCFLDHGC